MLTHVAFLRGINLGGGYRVAMADLGRSPVAARLARPAAGLTARNRATVTKLAQLMEAS